jgi:serine/threonine-protein kinase
MTINVTSKRPAALTVGEVLDGKYQVLRELGRGAMGVVYEALHIALERRVAIKTLLEEVSADPQIGARFEREARAASAIGHPNIVDVFDLGRTTDGLLFMVMELLDGESLGSLLKKTPRLPIPLAVHLMAQVLSGLSAAHKHGIVHRDLKPDNIFVLDSEERPHFVKIVDFGISKVLTPPSSTNPNATAKVAGTMVGSVLGTPLYMSPEQAIGQIAAIDHRTDVYSAGVVLYEMVCGRTPYLGESFAQIFAGLLEGDYPPPRSLAPELSSELEAAIVCALDRDMGKRFPSAAAMRQAIRSGLADTTPPPMLMPVSLGTALRTPEAAPQGIGNSSIALLENPVPDRTGRTGSGANPFAPPPEANLSPILADDLDRPLAARAPIRAPGEPMSLDVVKRKRPCESVPAKGTLAPSPVLSARGRSRLLRVVAVLAVAIVARVAYSVFRPDGQGSLSIRRGASEKVALAVAPGEATVQIDHRPTTQREFALEAGTEHVLNAAAPGRLTRRFSFVAQPGLRLNIHLGHTLPLPSPIDPAPLPAEVSADCPEQARDGEDIESAFGKLDRYAECLALTGDANAEAKKGPGHGRMRAEEYGLCQRLVAEAAAAQPAMPELQAAAEATLGAIHGGQRLEQLARLAATFRAEFLVARTTWQLEELAHQQKLDGQSAGWHMRRVALDGQAWLRALKAGQGVEQAASKLQSDHRAFLALAQKPDPQASASGQPDFVRAAEGLVALAGTPSGKRPTEIVALDGARRLISAFNALILQ